MGERPQPIAFVAESDEQRKRVEADLRQYAGARLRLVPAADPERAAALFEAGEVRAVLLACAQGGGAPARAARFRARAARAPLVVILPPDDGSLFATLEAGAHDALPENEIGGGALGHLLHTALARSRGQTDAPQGPPAPRESLPNGARALAPFASVVVHDLHEPLRVVVEYGRLLALRLQRTDDPSIGRYLERVSAAGRRMQEHLAGLLDYARAGSRPLAREPIACEDVLQSALANLKVAIEESGAVVTHGPLPRVTADPVQLVVVFQNLVANAIKHRGAATPEIRVEATPCDGGWQLSVRDNGPGFDPEEAPRVFEAFYRLRSATDVPGSGVGLAICKAVVEGHGGRIWVDTRSGRGAAFHFTLPEGTV